MFGLSLHRSAAHRGPQHAVLSCTATFMNTPAPAATGTVLGDRPAPAPKTRTERLALIPIALLLGVVLLVVSRLRLVDGDEGFYLLAAKSVYHGKVLYRDFFYTQMPLLPYVYGLWMKTA